MAALAQKLQIKVGQLLLVRLAPGGYMERLGAEIEGIRLTLAPADAVDGALIFVTRLDDVVREMNEGVQAIRHDGLLWMAYPKGTSKMATDVNRDRLWQTAAPTGWRPVRQVALDEIWSALRFRPNEMS